MMPGVPPKMTGPSCMRDIVHVVLSLETEPLNFAASGLFVSNRLGSIVIRKKVGRARLRNPSGIAERESENVQALGKTNIL